ncbi:MAG: SdiA-regulated domain-containing protein [Ignavibacteria bacterium]|nr:SdiA-regulated domain-containing protein [Ignavibacteria bacterium]MBT8383860.1 SdiA-regulated domain-containing protein [Ignavibacteria bacterium]MBT8390741.1 SdiA-regulated domain-containing protein [Ignavibacteria bacterium]NNJ53410.1 hypothetical protein [Ignavibacteriaceae bacterium]NNL22415.1 hypothetical protein [Ignavibacteriaceae bacterium]
MSLGNNINLVLLVTIFLRCSPSLVDDKSILNYYGLNNSDNRIIHLPKALQEVSGLAFKDDKYLLTHNDEKGIVFKMDVRSGEVVSEFSIGEKEIERDFEGIAVVKDSIFLVTSKGTIFKFSTPGKYDNVDYVKINTPLSSKDDVEGLCYDEKINSLLLACKSQSSEEDAKYKAVYEFSLTEMNLIEKPRYLISLKELKKKFDIKDFSPSGIEINPINRNIFLISANPEVIVELNSEGEVLNAKVIDDKNHKQPEGIAFLKDGTMILADESNGKKAKLTFIHFNK